MAVLDLRSLKALPKAHLHLHLEGSMRPTTLDELCERYGVARPADTRGKRFSNFLGFNKTYWAATECLRSRDDLARLVLEVAEDARDHGATWIEPAFDTERYSSLRAGSPYQLFGSQEEGWGFMMQTAAAASRATGVGIGFISAVDRTQPMESAVQRAKVTAEFVRSNGHRVDGQLADSPGPYPGLVGFGLHSNEEGFPPEPFAPVFDLALDGTGLLSAPHAGEIAPFPGRGPASVAAAIGHLRADRIAHGVLAATDRAVVDRLACRQVCLDICPTSNLLLSVVPSIDAHPLPQLMEAGVPCDIGSDDPLLFGPSLLEEFELCRSGMGLGDDALAELARNSFRFSGAPEGIKAAGLRGIDAWLTGSG